jgi:hypothetical protein
MSTVSRRPRVKSISSAALDAAAVACVAAVGTVVSSAIRALDAASRTAWAESNQKLPSRNVPAILPVSSIRAQMPVVCEGIQREINEHKLPPVESAKLAALMALQVAPYACEPVMLQAPVEALIQARTEAEVTQASRRLQQAAETGHQQIVVVALTTAAYRRLQSRADEAIELPSAFEKSI